jgi:hypothetical protein
MKASEGYEREQKGREATGGRCFKADANKYRKIV